MADVELIKPDWPAPAAVRAVATTRSGGISQGPYASLNLGIHVGDNRGHVGSNRGRLTEAAGLPATPVWLNQVHGTRIADPAGVDEDITADGATTVRPGVVCVVLTADCLPVLICDRAGQRVAAVHAGWRGLAGGVVARAVASFTDNGIAAAELIAWLGPAIGQAAYEVGDEVKASFEMAADSAAFAPNDRGRWQCDLYALARHRLAALGVEAIYGGRFCTHAESTRFFSHRRDGTCGRQATLIWLESR
jgi:YfiH family protein